MITKLQIIPVISAEYAAEKMEKIAWEALHTYKRKCLGKIDDANVRTFLTDQRNNILVYLPAGLQIGRYFE